MLISIVIPTYGRPASLLRCLQQLAQQTLLPHEVVVVDDGSPNDPRQELEQQPLPYPLRLIRQPNRGPGAARNHGARLASGDFLVFIDDDCMVEESFLRAYAQAFEFDGEALWSGKVLTAPDRNLYCKAAQVVVDMATTFYNPDPSDGRFYPSNNLGVKRSRYLEVGGFEETYFRHSSEDRELCDRWTMCGGRIRHCPEARLYHEPPLAGRSYLKMYFRYGRGAYRYQRIRELRGSGRLQDDVGFHFRLPGLLRQALRPIPPHQWPGIGLLLVAWQVMNLAGFAYEVVSHRLQRPEARTDEAAKVMHQKIAHRPQPEQRTGAAGEIQISGPVEQQIEGQ